MVGLLSMSQRIMTARNPIAAPVSMPSPITGWNTRDALTAMDPTDAVLLDNWYPDAGGVILRQGYQVQVSGLGTAPVETLAEYTAAQVHKQVAACGSSVFDTSTGVAVSLATGFNSARWQTTNFNGHLFMANGTDAPQIYDGVTLSPAAYSGPASLTNLLGVEVYQDRMFFWENTSQRFWYTDLFAISGPLKFFDLSSLSNLGGNIVVITTMTHDGGDGVSDFILFVMSSGDTLIYFGSDPGDANNWTLVGRYRIAPPVSPRAAARYGADSFMTTFDDHIPLQQQLVALKVGTLPPRSKVSDAVRAAMQSGAALPGWQAIYYPAGRRLMFNVPNVDGTFDQHVLNTSQNAWCRFKGMPSHCWGLFNNRLFFGGPNGTVYQADIGNTDLFNPIMGDGQQAWNPLNSPQRKRITATRPIVQQSGTAAYQFGIGFDYGDFTVPVAAFNPGIGPPWDTTPWDSALWGRDSQIDTRWRTGGGTGVSIGFRLQVSSFVPMSWLRTDFRFETGIGL